MMGRMTRLLKLVSILALVLALIGCAGAQTTKRYTMTGTVKEVDMANKSALIDHDKIENWMDAMMMDYPIKPDAEFAKLHVGDKIQATVVVNDLKYYVTDVKVLPKP